MICKIEQIYIQQAQAVELAIRDILRAWMLNVLIEVVFNYVLLPLETFLSRSLSTPCLITSPWHILKITRFHQSHFHWVIQSRIPTRENVRVYGYPRNPRLSNEIQGAMRTLDFSRSYFSRITHQFSEKKDLIRIYDLYLARLQSKYPS